MTFDERLADILARMREAKLDAIVALHDGAHFIEKPNPVTVLTGFKSLGPAAAILRSDGATTLIVDAGAGTPSAPPNNARRRAWPAPTTLSTRSLAALSNGARKNAGLAGMRFLPSFIADRVAAALPARTVRRQARVRRRAHQDRRRDCPRARGRRASPSLAIATCSISRSPA